MFEKILHVAFFGMKYKIGTDVKFELLLDAYSVVLSKRAARLFIFDNFSLPTHSY